MRFKILCICLAILSSSFCFSQVKRVPIGTSTNPDKPVQLTLVNKIQNYSRENGNGIIKDPSIYSPKSVVFLKNGKMYVNSLEGFSTSVYKTGTWERENIIRHKFTLKDSALFVGTPPFGYKFDNPSTNNDLFSGKPVEFTTSDNQKKLWISYYRRSFDKNASQPSAMALVNTENDSIEAVFPTGPLPKMLAANDSSKKLAITHWGDNTVGLINMNEENPHDYVYEKHFIIGEKLSLNYDNGQKINRDSNCGYCLRGTAFSEDGKYLFIARMGGTGKIDVFNMETLERETTLTGSKNNIRHLIIKGETLFISTNVTGFIQKTSISFLYDENAVKNSWRSIYVGKGVRTISITSDSKYIFAAVNNESKLVIVDSESMTKISTIETDSYPVGMDISPNDDWLAVTAQGKKGEGGHSISIYKIDIN